MRELPTGTVTLLFSDIEGSTRLLQQVGERYPDVLAACRRLLRAAFQQYQGYEVDTQGDSLFVAFARASDAVLATVEAQRALATHDWPQGAAVRVRMGLHTGEPQLSPEGYVGLDVHRAARIMSAGHGGQVLLSQTTRDLVEHELPDGVSLRDLGAHRLKDLEHPHQLYQLVIADLAADFPPLKTLDTHTHNLPAPPTPFIGRQREVAAIQQLLHRPQVRLVTLTGPGGSGKTRLGLQVAAELLEVFRDGVYFVNLAPINDPELVVSTIGQTLGLKESPTRSMLEQLEGYLQKKQVLLVLDNFEQVAAAALRLSDLLTACSRLKLLVTSRQVLRLSAEHQFAVPPLSLPDLKHLPDLVTLSQYEAVALFISRAQAVKPDFQVGNANAAAVAEICTRLDGLPLAIELAAARSKLLPPQALLARLEKRLAVLTSGTYDLPARQQTLSNTIEWSYHLLNVEEQRLFCRLSVFVGGSTLEAIEAVYAPLGYKTGQVLDGVASLLDKSFLRQGEQEDEEPRFVMLETIREYGLECLETSGEMEAARLAHAEYYLVLAEKSEPEFGGPKQVITTMRLEREQENLRAALYWLIEYEEREKALRLSGALWRFWRVRGPQLTRLDWLKKVLSESDGVQTAVRAKALYAAGELALLWGDVYPAAAWGEESLMLYRELGDKRGIAASLMMLGAAASERGNFAAALALYEESLALRRELEDHKGVADTLMHQGWMYFVQGNFAKASEHYEESLQIFRNFGDREAIATALASLGNLAAVRGEYARAYALHEESLELSRELRDQPGIANSLYDVAGVAFLQGDLAQASPLVEESLALIKEVGDKTRTAYLLSLLSQIFLYQDDVARAYALLEESMALLKEVGSRPGIIAISLRLLARVKAHQGDHVSARALYEESLLIFREVGNRSNVAFCLEGLASVVAVQGEPIWAALLLGAAETLRETIGAPIPPVYRPDYEQSIAAVSTQLGEHAFAAAWAEGRTMTLEQVLVVRESVTISPETQPTPPTKSPPAYSEGLTAREVEVLRLVAQGLTDAQVAQQLVISSHTVNTHLKAIYGKIGVSSRSAATRYAIEHHLI